MKTARRVAWLIALWIAFAAVVVCMPRTFEELVLLLAAMLAALVMED